MSEPEPLTQFTVEQPDEQAITARLARLLEPRTLEELVELIESVTRDTGYGDVKIIILDHRVSRFRVEKSY
jgi:hypothetical protein